SKSPKPEALVPATRDGQIGALWSLRYVHALLAAQSAKLAAAEAIQTHSFTLRLIAAMLIGQRYNTDVAHVVRLWESVTTGSPKRCTRTANTTTRPTSSRSSSQTSISTRRPLTWRASSTRSRTRVVAKPAGS